MSSPSNETKDSVAVTEVKTRLLMDSDQHTDTPGTAVVHSHNNNYNSRDDNISEEGQPLSDRGAAASSAEDGLNAVAAVATLDCRIKQEEKTEAILDLSRIPAADDDDDEGGDDSADGIRYLRYDTIRYIICTEKLTGKLPV